MLNSRNLLSLFVLVAMMCSCYRDRTPSRFQFRDTLQIADTLTAEQQDSISFLHQHHFSENFNFIVRADSLNLLKQQPEELLTGMPTDSFAVKKGKRMVVADIRILPDDAVDSVWVKLATENYEFGWIQESQMLKKVDPDDPISQFISTFSDRHLIYFLLIISLMAAAYFYRRMRQHSDKIVHFNDIPSPYPMTLALIVAAAATFYASIQLFAPEAWREFYFHPSLNPFEQPLLLALFLTSVWLMLIVGIAAVDEVRRCLSFNAAVSYLMRLAAVCAFNYILFSISTLYYVGYPLLVAYVWFAVGKYRNHNK